jgi:metallo-beta-lactamase class B
MHKLIFAFATLFGTSLACSQTDWEAPFAPHQMIDNIYYVGTEGLATYLIVTDEGHILVNTDFERTVPILKANVEALGFRFEDIKIILGSHAHGDHMEGDALAKQMTGADVMAMAEDVPLLKNMRPGGREHPVDRMLQDGDEVALGGTVLTAHLTAGHTPGCTTWTLDVEENGVVYHAAIACSYGANAGYVLVNNSNYPQIAEDYRNTYAKARALPVDVFLASHGFFYDLASKYEKLQNRKPGDSNPYIDRAGFLAYVGDVETNFQNMLKEQQGRE